MLFASSTPATFSGFHGSSLALLVIGVVLVIAWLLVFAERYLATFPKLPPADAANNELRPEPPAVVNLLVNRWKPTRSAMAATLLDLAARKVVDIQQLDAHHFVIHLERVPADESTLAPYERQMLDFIRSRATGGSAPMEAITLGEAGEADAWWKRFAAAIGNDARRLGLARDRWAPRDWTVLGGLLAAALAALGGALALSHLGVTAHPSTSSSDKQWHSEDWLYAAAIAWVAVMVWIRTLRALRDTAAGRAACAHWLGVRAYLRSSGGFDELPPAAVVLWDRYLSYGAALGAAHDAVHGLPFVAEEPATAWSRASGMWRQLRIEYPTRFGFGESPVKVFLGGLVQTVFWGAMAFVVLPIVIDLAWSVLHDQLTAEQLGNSQLFIVLGLIGFAVVAGTYLVVRFFAGVIRLVRGARDLGKEMTIEGPIVKVHGGRIAVDQGTSDELVAWFPPAGSAPLSVGMTIRATMSPHLHHVTNVVVLSGAAAPAQAASGPLAAGLSLQPVHLTAADVQAVTGLALPAIDPATAGREAGILAGGMAAAFSDGKSMVGAAVIDASGPAGRIFEALRHIPGTQPQQIPGVDGEARWSGGRILLVQTGGTVTGVQVMVDGTSDAQRLEWAKALYQRIAGASAPPPTAASPEPV